MIGQTLSHCRITAALGAVGTREAGRATDTKGKALDFDLAKGWTAPSFGHERSSKANEPS